MDTGRKLDQVRRDLKRDFPGQSSREDDPDKGNQTAKQGRIESYGPMEYGSATAEAEESLPRDSDVRDTDPHPGTQTDPVSTNSDLLAQRDEYRLCQLTKFDPDRLKQAIEDRVELFSLMLRREGYFSGQEHAKVIELAEKGNRAESSAFFVNLVMGKDSRIQKAMWEFLAKMLPKLNEILKELQELGPDPNSLDLATLLKDVEQEHKKKLRAQTETLTVNAILVTEKEKVFQLVDGYVELTVVSTVRDRRLVEDELRARGKDHEERREKHLSGELEKIQLDQLFQNSSSQSEIKSGRSAVVAGGAGIGKTTMVQKIVYDWATGKIYQQFQFVFRFRFQNLNSINSRTNLRKLILDQYPYFGNLLREIWKKPERLLFIFDGLDEFKHKIDFTDSRGDTECQYHCLDPESWCEVSDIVYSLIQGELLPGCSVLVTTRPSELHLLEKAEISVRAEILGFVGEERKKYFIKYLKNENVAAAVLKHVEENEILYTMSYNPSYCLTLTLALEACFTQGDSDPLQVPATVTQLYSYYIWNILKNHSCEIEKPRDPLLRVGQMAYRGLSQRKVVFTDEDMNNCNVQPSQFMSAFLTKLLDNPCGVVYTFTHLIIQEFVAALAQLLTLDPRDIRNILSDACHTSDGRFEMLFRFVVGLSSPMRAQSLEKLLGPFPRETTGQVCNWLKEEVKRQSENTGNEDGRRLLNILHFLFESQDPALALDLLKSIEVFSFTEMTLTPMDCLVMSHFIERCDIINFLALSRCHLQCDGLQILGRRLHKVQDLRFERTKLGDSGVKLVSEALRNPECRIMKLWLNDVGLTESGVKDLTSALCTNRSLTDLNLNDNELGDSEVKLLSAALRNPESKIRKLWLKHVGLTESGVKDLTSALCTNPSLIVLDLSDNELGDSGVKLLSVSLRNPKCKIEELGLNNVGLTESGVKDLSSALSTNRSLTDLDLNNNKLGDSGVKLLSEALSNPECKIERLGLSNVGLTESGVKDLSSALSTNRSLTDLDLNNNKLGDSGVKLLSKALRNPECKLEKLRLWDVGFTDSGAKDLFSALSTNRSLTWLNLGANKLGDSAVNLGSLGPRNPEIRIQRLELFSVGLTDSGVEDLVSALSTMQSLRVLNLGLNSLTNRSVPALRQLIQTLTSLKSIKLDGNQFDPKGKQELRSLEESKRGLIVCL